MKKLILLLCAVMGMTACNTPRSYQSIAATEDLVLTVNSLYLSAVVSGQVSTNGVPEVEAAFNDTQMALKIAAVMASGGASATVPKANKAQADSFIKLVNSQPKVKP